jgi:hypothetical protein
LLDEVLSQSTLRLENLTMMRLNFCNFAATWMLAIAAGMLPAQQADRAGEERSEGSTDLGELTREARFRVSGEQLPVNFEQLNQIMVSSKVSGAAVSDISGKPAKPVDGSWAWTDGETTYTVVCNALMTRGGSLRGPGGMDLSVRFIVQGNAKSRSDANLTRLAEAVARRLAEALTEASSRESKSQVEKDRRALEEEIRLAAESEERVRHLRKTLRSIAPVEATQTLLTETLGNLQRQQQSFELELVGMKGRAEAIQNQIKQVTERLKGRAEGDEIVRNLQRVVNLRAEQLQRITDLKVYRTIDVAAKANAEEQYYLAQIELDRAKREAQKGPSDQLDKLNTELADIAISTASIDAKLKYVSRKLDETSKLLAIDVNDAQPVRDHLAAETAALQAALAEVQKRKGELSRQAARIQPVTVELQQFEPVRKSPKKE